MDEAATEKLTAQAREYSERLGKLVPEQQLRDLVESYAYISYIQGHLDCLSQLQALLTRETAGTLQ